MPSPVEPVSHLPADAFPAVLRVLAAAQDADGTAPLNEAATLALDGEAGHVLAWADGTVAGYGQLDPDQGTAQLVVAPAHRRQGYGTALLQALRDAGAQAAWAFGDHEPAQRFASARGLTPTRTLLRMERALPRRMCPDPIDGVRIASFRPGVDDEAVLALNAEAFAHHPEQGAMSQDDLDVRKAEPWFDPGGFLLAWEGEHLAGFHWTKRHSDDLGEVYVIAVSPRSGGRGVGRYLLECGLDHLVGLGCTRVHLYVEQDQERVVTLYDAAGFVVTHRDVLYRLD